VFDCARRLSIESILLALDRALDDGADVVNMSLGFDYGFSDMSLSRAASNLAERGVVVVSAAGNSGSLGLFASAAPAAGVNGLAVASFNGPSRVVDECKVLGAQGLDQVPVALDVFSQVGFPTNSPAALKAAVESPGQDGCAPFPEGYFNNHIALLSKTGCPVGDKATNAFAAGAKGVLGAALLSSPHHTLRPCALCL
jgi:minor extracellular serine protease Vpr